MNCKGFSIQEQGIIALLKSQNWVTGRQIQIAATHRHNGVLSVPTEHLRRLRALRKKGYKILCRCFGGRTFKYRLVSK